MASISEKLVGAGAQAKNDWAHASGATSLTFTGEAQFRRGIEMEIGLNALATTDAGLSQFIDATGRGNAFAEAQASLQIQLSLNLFDEFGLSVRAQAIPQAAAGIEAGLGLSKLIALVSPGFAQHPNRRQKTGSTWRVQATRRSRRSVRLPRCGRSFATARLGPYPPCQRHERAALRPEDNERAVI
jgi:hypothetical protein